MNDIEAQKRGKEKVLEVTFIPEIGGQITEFQVFPRNIPKLIKTLERALVKLTKGGETSGIDK